MSYDKPKRDNNKGCIQTVAGCFNGAIRILAGLLMLIFIGFTAFIIYSSIQAPPESSTMLIAFTIIIALACGYVAFNRSGKQLAKGDATLQKESSHFIRVIIRSVAGFLMFIFGMGLILLTLPLAFQYREPNMITFFLINLGIVIICGIVLFATRNKPQSDDIRDDLSKNKRKNDDKSL